MSDKYTVKALISIGRAEMILNKIFGNPLFDNLSKHNPWWDSEHEKEAELLHDIRCQFQSINDDLYELSAELKQDYDEDDE